MTSAQDAATRAAKLLLAVTTFESYKASIPPKPKERTAEQKKRYEQLREAIRSAKRPRAGDEGYEDSSRSKSNARNNAKNSAKRLKAGDEGYKESARSKYNAKNNAKGNAERAVQAAARSEAARQARGEMISTLTLVDACEQDAARCSQEFILPALQAGHGLDVMCMADHRLRPHRSSDAAADGASYEKPIVLTGLPYGGRTNDEATRWACLDSSPAIMSRRRRCRLWAWAQFGQRRLRWGLGVRRSRWRACSHEASARPRRRLLRQHLRGGRDNQCKRLHRLH